MDNSEISNYIVFGKPYFTEEDIAEVVETIRSGWIGPGPRVSLFEEKLRKRLGVEHAVAVQSCTAALYLALELIGIGPGDEVITTPITFPATANVIVHHGATPVFSDVTIASGNIDPDQIEAKVTPRTKAIIPVHLAGKPCDMNYIIDIARAHGLCVVEDAAHALEATYQGRQIGTIGDFGAFSFYPTKSLTTGDGGLLVTGDCALAERARCLRLHGINSDAWERSTDPAKSRYETIEAGYKLNLTDLQAALGLHQIERLDQNLLHRKKLWEIYDQGLQGLNGITLPHLGDDRVIKHARHLYIIYIDKNHAGISRDEMKARLHELGIGTGIHFTSLHLHQFYKEAFGFQREDLPNATWISDRTLSLPLGNGMKTHDAQRVVEAIHTIFKN